jgi:hypothetical protein
MVLPGKLENKIGRKTISVALHRAIESLGLDAVNARQIRVQNHLLTPHCEDQRLHRFQGDGFLILPHRRSRSQIATMMKSFAIPTSAERGETDGFDE